jgi:hypothetical protein
MRRRLVILSEPLSHLRRTEAHDRIEIGIVIRRSMKYLYPEGALFQVVLVSIESLLNDVPEQLRITLTGSESAVTHNLLELRAHEPSFGLSFRAPSTCHESSGRHGLTPQLEDLADST